MKGQITHHKITSNEKKQFNLILKWNKFEKNDFISMSKLHVA